MEAVCVIPHDEKHKIRLQGMNIKKRFMDLGFDTRSGFFGVVTDNYEEFGNYKGVKILLNWWLCRSTDPALNAQLEELIEKLKAE